jgi:hypothetical protein
MLGLAGGGGLAGLGRRGFMPKLFGSTRLVWLFTRLLFLCYYLLSFIYFCSANLLYFAILN